VERRVEPRRGRRQKAKRRECDHADAADQHEQRFGAEPREPEAEQTDAQVEADRVDPVRRQRADIVGE